MPSIEIGSDWRRFDLCFDDYRKKWEAMAIVPLQSGEPYWFKGWGVTVEDAVYDLKRQILTGTHIGKLYHSKSTQIYTNGIDAGKPTPKAKDYF